MERVAIHLVIGLICGAISAAIAAGKGRNAVGWFFGGFFLGLIGIVIVACLGNLKEQRAYRRQMESEAHRLREQLRLERIKGEVYRQHTAERLDVHDHALGMDTRSTTALSGGRVPAQLPGGLPPVEDPAAALEQMTGGTAPPSPAKPASPRASRTAEGSEQSVYGQGSGAESVSEVAGSPWYYENHGRSVGPVSEAEIRRLLRSGAITGDTLLWTEGMLDWLPARSVVVLRAAGSS